MNALCLDSLWINDWQGVWSFYLNLGIRLETELELHSNLDGGLEGTGMCLAPVSLSFLVRNFWHQMQLWSTGVLAPVRPVPSMPSDKMLMYPTGKCMPIDLPGVVKSVVPVFLLRFISSHHLQVPTLADISIHGIS